MDETQYRLLHFEELFQEHKGKRIFLYGFGRNARELLAAYDRSFGFAGIILPAEEIPFRRAEARAFGKELFTLEEAAARMPDMILLAAQMFSGETIFRRIEGFVRTHKIPLYSLYGFELTALHDEIEAQPYLDLSGWRKKLAGYGTVSFALDDTFIVKDLFHSREARVRSVWKKLLPELKANGTKVLLIGVEETPKERYREILLREGVFRDEKEFDVSYLENPHTERFFRDVRESFAGRGMLHIGHDVLNDGIVPRLCGLDTFRMVFYGRRQLTETGRVRPGTKSLPYADRERLLEAIRNADAVSFDIFDTLLIRDVLHFTDVFYLLARKAFRKGIFKSREEADSFLAMRLQKQTAHYTLADIYRSISEELPLSERDAEILKDLELEIEEQVIRPRREAAGIFREAVRDGKRVFLTSDMYLPSEMLSRIAANRGITGWEELFVSCEHGLTKTEGLLAVVRDAACGQDSGARLLHIGDNPDYDILSAQRLGIPAVKIPAVRELAAADGWRTDEPAGKKLAERVLAGVAFSELYADPFGQVPTRERRLYVYGFAGMSPVICAWMCWLLRKLRTDRPDKVLFAARDGWLLHRIYEKLRGRYGLPQPVYFYTSRHAAFLACADRPETAGYIADMAEDLSDTEMLRNIYGIDPPDAPEGPTGGAAVSGEKTGTAGKAAVIRKHMPQIRAAAEEARKKQTAYCRACGLTRAGRFAFVEFVAAGTCQRMLEESTGFSLKGYYFGKTKTENALACETDSFLSGKDGSEKRFLQRYLEMEYYLAAPEPSLREYDQDGRPVFAEETRSREELEELRIAQQGVLDFADRFFALIDADGLPEIPADPAVKLYLYSAGDDLRRTSFDDWCGTGF